MKIGNYRPIDGFARCLVDEREPGKIRHMLKDLLTQRIFGLACGPADANDADRESRAVFSKIH